MLEQVWELDWVGWELEWACLEPELVLEVTEDWALSQTPRNCSVYAK